MLWSPLELVVSWQLHPAFEELVENLGVNDAVGEGNTAVSVGGGGRILFCMAPSSLFSMLPPIWPLVIDETCGFNGGGFCCFSSMTVKST
jgi:hypothetical protein